MVKRLRRQMQRPVKLLAMRIIDRRKVDQHIVFVSKLSDSLKGGIGNLVDADMATESAKLQALQIKQQLGAQAVSIANSAPQIILSLFQG